MHVAGRLSFRLAGEYLARLADGDVDECQELRSRPGGS